MPGWAELIAPLGALAVFLALAASDAGFYPLGSDEHEGLGWYQAAVVLIAALVAAAVVRGRPARPPKAVIAAVALLGGFTVWTFLSIAWAEDAGQAWDGANRTAMYLTIFMLFALWPMRGAQTRVLLGALGLGLAALGLIQALRLGASEQPIRFFVGIRLAEPAGYNNANVALWTLGLFPCLLIAADRRLRAPLRGIALGSAGLLACLALMGQSRGWALALPLAVLLFLALVPNRVRAIAALVAVGLAVLLASEPLLAVHDDFSRERFGSLVDSAVTASLVVAAVLAALGTVAAIVDSRVRIPARHARRTGLAVAAVAALLAVGGGVFALTAGDAPERISEAWRDFKHGAAQPEEGSSRFTASGNNRYDFWRVAGELFEEHPLRGVGIENFQHHYLERARSPEKPRYPHSLPLGVLSQTGLVGALLFAGFLVVAVMAAARGLRGGRHGAGAVAAASLAGAGYWLLHASVDWFWELPALTGPALAMLGLAIALAPRGRPPLASGHRAPLAVTAAAALAGILLCASLAVPWLSRREIDRAVNAWRADPVAAFERLDRAASLNPLSATPHLTAGAIAVKIDDDGRARREYESALERQPRDAFALLQLAALASEAGDRGRSLDLLAQAHRLNRRDGITKASLERVQDGGILDIRDVNRQILRQVRSQGE